jgi:hypothetical protein
LRRIFLRGQNILKIKFPLYCILNQKFLGIMLQSGRTTCSGEGVGCFACILIVPFPSFPLHQASSTLQHQQQRHQSPKLGRVRFHLRKGSQAPRRSKRNAERPSCQRSAVNPRWVSCDESPLKPHSGLSESACWSTTCFSNSNFY